MTTILRFEVVALDDTEYASVSFVATDSRDPEALIIHDNGSSRGLAVQVRQAPAMLAQRPDITAAELARLTGISDRHARRLVNGNHGYPDSRGAGNVRPDGPQAEGSEVANTNH